MTILYILMNYFSKKIYNCNHHVSFVSHNIQCTSGHCKKSFIPAQLCEVDFSLYLSRVD